jgi:hypothetical protein
VSALSLITLDKIKIMRDGGQKAPLEISFVALSRGFSEMVV